MRTVFHRIAHSAGACCAMLVALTAHGAEVSQHDLIDAVWKPQSIMFEYRSEGRRYPCAMLESKIRMILHRLGAHDRLELRQHRCRDLGGRARFEILMESPVPATTENIHDITHYDSEDELIARVRGVPLRSAADLERFHAAWESISFRRDRKIYLEAGDCALVQQLRRQILPKMSIQVTKDITGLDCSQELAGISSPRLTVLALVPANIQPRLPIASQQ